MTAAGAARFLLETLMAGRADGLPLAAQILARTASPTLAQLKPEVAALYAVAFWVLELTEGETQ